jgi:hypothetical protein
VTRIALYSHDSVGLGHVRRNLALAHALNATLPELTGEPVSGLLITGHSDATTFPIPDGWDWLVVPGLTKGAEGYEARHLHLAMPALTTSELPCATSPPTWSLSTATPWGYSGNSKAPSPPCAPHAPAARLFSDCARC